MKIYDISVPVSPNLPTWPGDPAIEISMPDRIADGSVANISRLAFGVHTGTHVDAPLHFVDGAATVDAMGLEPLVGPVQVVEVSETVGAVDAGVVAGCGLRPGVERVLFKTRNSRLWREEPLRFHRDFAAITADGAQALAQRGLKLVGIDYYSVAPFDAPTPTHQILLGAGIMALEGIDLGAVAPGEYTLMCLPLKLMGVEGAPARAILLA